MWEVEQLTGFRLHLFAAAPLTWCGAGAVGRQCMVEWGVMFSSAWTDVKAVIVAGESGCVP